MVEQTGNLTEKKLRPDILVCGESSPPFVIECSYQAQDADKDAMQRLGKYVQVSGLPIKTAFALHVPEAFRKGSIDTFRDLLNTGEEIRYAVHQRSRLNVNSRWPSSGFIEGSAQDFAALLPAAALHKEDIATVATEVAGLLRYAAELLHQHLPEHIQSELVQHVFQRSPLAGLRTIMVLWLDAALTESMLYRLNKTDEPPEGIINSADRTPWTR